MVVWLHADPWPQKHNTEHLNNDCDECFVSDNLLWVSSWVQSLAVLIVHFSILSNFYSDQIYLQHLTNNIHWKHTCGEHARVGVSRRETHVLLDASAGAFGHPLDRQVLGLLQCPPPCAALIMDSLHSAVQWWLERLQLGGGLPQQEARHKLTQHWWTLVLLNRRGGVEIKGNNEPWCGGTTWNFLFFPSLFILYIFIYGLRQVSVDMMDLSTCLSSVWVTIWTVTPNSQDDNASLVQVKLSFLSLTIADSQIIYLFL